MSTIVGTAPLTPTADPSQNSYEVVRFNALKHGILSRYTVLSHENHADYESLVNSLMAEHLPAGATEQHLVEELASIIWRKDRPTRIRFKLASFRWESPISSWSTSI